jgi:hypothetical protein
MVVDSTVLNHDVLPIIYYRPFKASEIYLRHHFPDLFLTDYLDKFWYAERYFNPLKAEYTLDGDHSYYDFKTFLTAQCFVFPIPFMTVESQFMLHYVFNDYKIAINYHLSKTLIHGEKEASEMVKLPGKILKLKGWEVFELTEPVFKDWTLEERISNVKGWLKEAKDR